MKGKLSLKNYRNQNTKVNVLLLNIVFILFLTNSCILIKSYNKNAFEAQKIFYEDIVPIINKKCMNCHSADQTLINFSDYESIFGRRAMIKYMIEKDLMPPWLVSKEVGEWKNDFSLTAEEKKKFLKWLNTGLSYKNKNIKLFNFYKNSRAIKNPDYVIQLKEPVEIPVEGAGLYKKLILEPNFKEDKWVKEIEFILKPQVIHHIGVHIVEYKYLSQMKNRPPDTGTRIRHNLTGWLPGGETYIDLGKKNMGVKIPKNTFIVMFIHYEPIGKKTIDTKTKVKFKFYSKIPKYERRTILAKNSNFHIPPSHDNYLVSSWRRIKKDTTLLSITSHMHLRGKASSVFLIDPKGKKEEIYRLKTYNFNFQNEYVFKKPIWIRKGSILVCNNWFDNSANNPVNPNPLKAVRYGLYLQDEMSECMFVFKIPTHPELQIDRYNL